MMEGFSPASPPRIFWNSRKRSANSRSLENALREEESLKAPTDQPKETAKMDDTAPAAVAAEEPKPAELSERRKALFEPLEPVDGGSTGRRRPRNEDLLPPPDFDSMSYPKGWLVGKKRKLVNVDVVESMRRIAVQEMNRKDREIDGLNEQLEEDARCLEHLQVQLLQERSKRAEVEREKAMLQNQVSMLMGMLEEAETQAAEEDEVAPRGGP